MVRRLYLMPYTLQSTLRGGTLTANAPKYQSDIPTWGCLVLGKHCMVHVSANAAVHAVLGAYPDVIQSNANLTTTVGTEAAVVNIAFEAAGYPGDVTPATTWRMAFRKLCAVGQFLHRTGENSPLSGISRNTQFKDLPARAKILLLRAADSQGFDLRSLSTSLTLRVILRLAGANYRGKIRVGGESL